MASFYDTHRAIYHVKMNERAWRPGAFVTDVGILIPHPRGEYADAAGLTAMFIANLMVGSRWTDTPDTGGDHV